MNSIKKSNNLSVVIPIYKEKKNIEILTKSIRKHILNINFEIIFVDDNSPDGSNIVLNKLKLKYKNFRPIIRKNKKRDLTQSCFDGIKISKFENILIMDGDLQHNPKYIPILFKKFKNENADFAVATRDILFGKNPGLKLFRRLFSIILIIFTKLITTKTKDPMSGFFIFKKNLFEKNKKFFFGKGYKILLDLMIGSGKKIKVVDHNIIFEKRGNEKSKMDIGILLLLLKFYLYYFVRG